MSQEAQKITFVNNRGEQNSPEVKGSLPVLLETLLQFLKALFTMTMHHDHVLTRPKEEEEENKEPSAVANPSNPSALKAEAGDSYEFKTSLNSILRPANSE